MHHITISTDLVSYMCSGLEFIKLFFTINSTDHAFSTAHNNKISEIYYNYSALNYTRVVSILLINVKLEKILS